MVDLDKCLSSVCYLGEQMYDQLNMLKHLLRNTHLRLISILQALESQIRCLLFVHNVGSFLLCPVPPSVISLWSLDNPDFTKCYLALGEFRK